MTIARLTLIPAGYVRCPWCSGEGGTPTIATTLVSRCQPCSGTGWVSPNPTRYKEG